MVYSCHYTQINTTDHCNVTVMPFLTQTHPSVSSYFPSHYMSIYMKLIGLYVGRTDSTEQCHAAVTFNRKIRTRKQSVPFTIPIPIQLNSCFRNAYISKIPICYPQMIHTFFCISSDKVVILDQEHRCRKVTVCLLLDQFQHF